MTMSAQNPTPSPTDHSHPAESDSTGGDHGNGREHQLHVEFLDLNTNDVARFTVPSDLTLAGAWDIAYHKLKETRRENDVLESRTGAPLTASLGLTMEQVREQLVHDLRFQIHGEKGGA